MKIVLIGATGFVGSAVLNEALGRKHEVTAILRNPVRLTIKNNNLSVVQGDVTDTNKLAGLLKGNDIVVSAYNAGWSNPNIYDDFLKDSQSIQEAVKKSGIKRLIVMGGAGSLFIKPGVQLIDTPGVPEFAKAGSQAARDYLNILKKDDQLDWTFISPAIEMGKASSGTRTGKYRTGSDSPVFDANRKSSISVEDLAVAAMDEVEKPLHIRQQFTVGY